MSKANIPTMPDMKLELVPIPVADVDRAKTFYVEKIGFNKGKSLWQTKKI
jgi:extradiol dioxygenase family protein